MIWLAMLVLLYPISLSRDMQMHSELVVWNVGQGQFVTYAQNDMCLHFDMGGEQMNSRQLRELCHNKINEVYLSHWDWDHIGLITRVQKILPNLCIRLRPLMRPRSHKVKMLDQIADCQIPAGKIVASWSPNLHLNWSPRTSNDFSHVQVLLHRFLIPGDSPKKEEMQWSHRIAGRNIRVLILGHHGSRTSTSQKLLQSLPHLRLAISSARFKRYGHPHIEVVRRLRKAGVSLLRTEEWGNIIFEI